MQTDYIQSDETTIPVMNDERHKKMRSLGLKKNAESR